MKKQVNKIIGRTTPFNSLTLLLLMGCAGHGVGRVPQPSPAETNPQTQGEAVPITELEVPQREAITSDEFTYQIAENTSFSEATRFEIIENPADDSGSFTVTPEGQLQFDTPVFTLNHEDETANEFSFTVRATDEEGSVENVNIVLRLVDINDEAPEFADQLANFSVDTTSWTFEAATPDVSGDGVQYQFAEATSPAQQALFDLFELDAEAQTLTLKSGARLPGGELHTLVLTATVDEDGNALSTSAELTVDATDYEITFANNSQSTFDVDEKGSFAAVTFSATSANNETVTYALAGPDADAFRINETTGELTANDGTTFGLVKNTYSIVIEASNSLVTVGHEVTITVNDVAADGPTFTGAMTATVAENDNSALFQLLSATSDNGTVRYAIADDYDGPVTLISSLLNFKVNYPGDTVFAGFDFETDGNSHIVPIIASDDSGETRQDFVITITDVANEAPVGADTFVSVVRGQDYTFTADDFAGGYSDDDSHDFAGIQIVRLPQGSEGTLYMVDSGVKTAVSVDPDNFVTISAADISKLVFELASDAGDAAHEVDFGYLVVDSSGDVATVPVDMTLFVRENYEDLTLPTGTAVNGDGDDNTLSGTALAELIQGGDGDDSLIGLGGNDVFVGGLGDDTITLGADTDEVIYRFDSDADGNWLGLDGSDVIHNFERGVDKLLFIDNNPDGINDFGDFIAQAQQQDNLGVKFLLDDDSNYTGLVFNFNEETETQTVTLNFTDPIGADLLDELNITGSVLSKDNYQHLNRILNGDALSENFDITTDLTPSDLDII